MARGQDVLTFHNNQARTGVQSAESNLNLSNVNASQFGKVFSFATDGEVYAQPLYASNILMNDGAQHNVLFVATERDTVYAFDADGNNPSQGYLWKVSLLGSGETWVSYTDVGTNNIAPDIGITGTPVIDKSTGTIYVVAKSKNTASTSFFQRLHALNLSDGTEKMNGPTLIAATVPGTASGGTTVSFSAKLHNQRVSLLLAATPGGKASNSVFIGWGSHGDVGSYHGWIIAYDASDISQQTGVFASTPDGPQGGIWMSGGGIAADSSGNIYFGTGNGLLDANGSGRDYGDAAVKMTPNSTGLGVADWFSPLDEQNLQKNDLDFATCGPVLLPDQTGPIAHLLAICAKTGHIYLLNRDKMGHYSSGANPDVQDWSGNTTGYYSNFAFFQNRLYAADAGGPAKAWSFDPTTGKFNTTPQSQTSHLWGNSFGGGNSGSNLTISANGTQDGIVWALDNVKRSSGPAVLYAFDAANLSTMLYNSSQAADNRDQAAPAVEFTSPTVANGRVYVGGVRAITVYGLANFAATPVLSPGTQTFNSAPLSVSISDSTSGASIYYTTNGSTPTSSSNRYTGPISISSTTTIKAVAVATGYTASAVASATYTYAPPQAATPTFNPGAETFSTSPLSVSLSDSTSGAVIHYTTDGSTPTTTSTVYSSPVSVSGTTTIKAIATASGYSTSGVGSAAYTFSSSQSGVGVSDDFDSSSLNTSLWVAKMPAGGSATESNGHLSISIPGGSNHQPYGPGLNVGRVVQQVSNSDFDVAIKLDSQLTASSATAYQGLLVGGDASNYIYLSLQTDGSNVDLFAASVDAGTQNIHLNATPLTGYAAPTYLRIARSGTNYTGYWSTDGANWTQAVGFSDGLVVSALGPFAGNYNSNSASAPAVTASVDWFHNLSSSSTPQAATPSFSPGSQSFSTAPLSVSLSDSTSGASIFYTTDGSTPTTSSAPYTGPIGISATTTIHAIASAPGYTNSGVASATYTYMPAQGGAPVSDDFNGTSLNGSLWTVRAPSGGSASVGNGHLIITVPGGSNHDVVIPALDAVQVVQPVSNADFDVGIKLDSTLSASAQYSMQGILIYGDGSNYLRYEVYATGSAIGLYAASIDAGTQNIKLNTVPFSGYVAPTYLRLKRSGSTYTGYWSTDGTNWTQAVSFSDGINVTAMGPYGANYNSTAANAPALSVSVDWFHNLATTAGGGISLAGGFSTANLAFNGAAKLNGARLRLTDGGGYEQASAFYTTAQSVQKFTTSFSFQLANATADGFTFTMQNAGTTALGPYGAGLGFGGTGGIPNSVAVKFDLYNNAGEGSDSTGIYSNGAAPTTPAIDLTNTGINLHSGDTFNVAASYDGTTLSVTITDTVTQATATQSYPIDIPSVIGSSTAFIGFTGGTGGATATQEIIGWTYTPQ